jgi:hypothetical protein
MEMPLAQIEPQALALQIPERMRLAFRLLDSCGSTAVTEFEQKTTCSALEEAIAQMERSEGSPAEDVHRRLFGRSE